MTGGAGFIGSHLCETLLERGACVIALDDLDDGGPYPRAWKEANLALLRDVAARRASLGARLLVVRADASDPDAIAPFFASSSDDSFPPATRVCHLAARSGVKAAREDPAGAVRANVESVASTLRVALASPRGVRAFVLASSGAVYGDDARPTPTPNKREPLSNDPRDANERTNANANANANSTANANANAPRPTPSREADALVAAANPYAATKLSAEVVARAVFASFPLDLSLIHI